MSEAPYANDGTAHGFSHRDSTASVYRDNSNIGGIASTNDGASDFGWSNLHAQHGNNGVDFVHPYFGVSGHDQDLLSGEGSYNPWQFSQQNAISYHDVAARLVAYLQLDVQHSADSQVARGLLTPENVEQFLIKYLNFHQHWPNIHMPTFNPLTSYPGLVLAMCTVGAAYSERVVLAEVRTLLRVVKTHVSSLSEAGRAARDLRMDVSALIDNQEVLEQIASLGILTKMVLWHSEPENRVMLNSDHTSICQLVKRLGMLEALPRDVPGHSELHQSDAQINAVTPTSFDYLAWLRQEKRSRTTFIIVQADMAHFLYFNSQPNFTNDEIKLPLPADDAAWEAQNAVDCCTALGLYGSEAQEGLNIAGSRRPKQIEFNQAMRVLQHPMQDFAPRSTNAYGKFMMVHGIHVQIWFAQHHQFANRPVGGSPLPPADWITGGGSVTQGSGPSSGHGTPTSDANTISGVVHLLDHQLTKWQRHWDEDDALEYPSNTTQPRVGFCRDGKPFFWLGRMLLKSLHQMDPNAPWQKRFAQMMTALKQAKMMSQNDENSSSLGLTISSDFIDPQYGVDDLTLDMKLLFSPISPAGSPAVQPGAFTTMGP